VSIIVLDHARRGVGGCQHASFGTSPAARQPLRNGHHSAGSKRFLWREHPSAPSSARLEDHNWFRPSNQVIILDKRTGQLWSWYESIQTINYLGQIFPLGGSGSIARIIQVPEQR
jgi:hypothetical protein